MLLTTNSEGALDDESAVSDDRQRHMSYDWRDPCAFRPRCKRRVSTKVHGFWEHQLHHSSGADLLYKLGAAARGVYFGSQATTKVQFSALTR